MLLFFFVNKSTNTGAKILVKIQAKIEANNKNLYEKISNFLQGLVSLCP